MVDAQLAFDILARDRNASSTFNKVASAADRTAASLAKTAKMSDLVTKAEGQLLKARSAESDALGRVRVAETKLAEVRKTAKEGSSKFVAAEEALAAARRKAAGASNSAMTAENSLSKARKQLAAHAESVGKDAGKSFGDGFGGELDQAGGRAGKRFGSGLKKWFVGEGGGLFKQIGNDGSSVFGSGFLGALKTPILGPAIVGIIGGAVATAMPAVGAVAAGALVTGFGAGLIGLGAVFAAKSNGVKNAWKSTLTAMGADMRILSAPFQKTLISMAGVARRTFADFKPQLEVAFKGLAPVTAEFGSQLGMAFAKLAPAIQPVSVAMAGVLKSLGPGTVAAIGSISDGLIRLSESVQKSPNAMADLVSGVGELTQTLLDGVTTLNDINGAFERFTGGLSLVDVVMGGLRGTVGTLFGPFGLLKQAMAAVGIEATKMNATVAISEDTAKLWTQGLNAAQVAAIQAGGAIPGVGAAVESLATKFNRQWAATQKANEALTRMSGLLLTLSGSQIAYQQAVDDATASIKENGKTHDINTQKGRNNQASLDQVAASAKAQMLAMRDAGDGNVAAARTAEGARATYIKLATQMGYTVPQARAMAKSMIDIPNVTRTAKLQANKKDLETKLAQAEAALKKPGLTATKTAKLKAEIANLKAGIATAEGLLANLPASKTVSINITTYKRMIESTSVGGIPAGVAARAGGGPVVAGTPYLVGEKGPEIVVPSASGTVIPNDAIKVGQNVVAGMAGGVRASGAAAISAAGDVAAAMISKARAVLQISSPSKAFAQIGLYVNQGFSQGLRGSAKGVQSVMASLMSKVLNISFNAAETKASIQKSIASLNASIAAARKRIKPITGGMSKAEVASAKRNNASVAASIKTLQAKLVTAKGDLANVSAIAARLGTTPKRNAIIGMLNRENKLMQAMANKRAAVAVQLKNAQTRLASAIQVRDEFRKAITDSALAFNSITNISDDGQALSGEGLIARMQNTLARTKEFAANLARLKKMGLRSDLYKQIAEAGVEGGSATAQALLQNGNNTVAWANNLQGQIATASAGLGNTAASNMYQAGVDAAQGLVNGLLAKTKALDAASKKLADAIVAQIKKTLGIRSPSRVLAGLGAMTGIGFAQGITGEYGTVAKAAGGLGDAATRRVGTPQRLGSQGTASGGAGTVINLTVNGALDPLAVAQQIQQMMIKLKRTNGGTELGLA